MTGLLKFRVLDWEKALTKLTKGQNSFTSVSFVSPKPTIEDPVDRSLGPSARPRVRREISFSAYLARGLA